ncbi:uncharacterized protein [Ptychodera flava]|uniref:uncharacterized protein n=1 Tax=Ptychodera flava TaxID=63121 RepID=UPI00396A9E84
MEQSSYSSVGHEDTMNVPDMVRSGSDDKGDKTLRKLSRANGNEKLPKNNSLTVSLELNRGESELTPSREVESPSGKTTLSTKPNSDLLLTVEKLGRHKGLVIVQFLNLGYINMTKSWICNVECMDILPFTILITSDRLAYWQLKEWKPDLNVVLQTFGDSKSMRHNEDSYNEYLCYRVRLVDLILNLPMSVFLVESDAVWFSNPLVFINRYSNVDIVANTNNALSEEKKAMAGFVFLNATSSTRSLWTKLRQKLDNISKRYQNGTGKSAGDMGIFNALLKKEKPKVEWFPADQFFSGLWYGQPKLRDTPKQPVVIQNNCVAGNDRKEKRAKRWSHWFLSNSTEECIGNPCR